MHSGRSLKHCNHLSSKDVELITPDPESTFLSGKFPSWIHFGFREQCITSWEPLFTSFAAISVPSWPQARVAPPNPAAADSVSPSCPLTSLMGHPRVSCKAGAFKEPVLIPQEFSKDQGLWKSSSCSYHTAWRTIKKWLCTAAAAGLKTYCSTSFDLKQQFKYARKSIKDKALQWKSISR